jgi:hypothetical protein
VPDWGDILKEVQQSAETRAPLCPDMDGIALQYLQHLHSITGRAVIVYASGFLQNKPGPVEGSDVHALMEVCHHVPERELDLIIHSPGGSGESAEQMVNYLRARFDYIRAFVPMQAKSAGTMIALGCDEIVLGLHSELGPIDPQIPVPLPGGTYRYAPAHAILRDFQLAQREIAADLQALAAWTPILQSYVGGQLEYCKQQIQLSQDVVAAWLEQYMLAHEDAQVATEERAAVARSIAEYFGSDAAYDHFRTHGRPIRIEELRKVRGLRVRALEADDAVQDAVLSIYHILDITFGGGAVAKIVANHLGKRYLRILQQVAIQMVAPAPSPSPPPTSP